MKASSLAVSASAVVVLVSALAETRMLPALHSDSLARYEAIASYCEKVDPSSASLYVAKLAGLTQSLSSDQVQNDRNSARYRAAMDEANATLSKASATTASRGCSEFLTEK